MMLFTAAAPITRSDGSSPACSLSSGFTHQIVSERGTNMIALLDANADGWMDLASVGWGDDGDPVIALWTNRVGSWLQGGGGPSPAAASDSSAQHALTIVFVVLSALLGLALMLALWKLRAMQPSRSSVDPFDTLKMSMLQDR